MFKQLQEAISRLKSRFNESLQKLPVIEQVQNAEQVGSAMQRIEWAAESLKEFFQSLEAKAQELEQGYNDQLQQAVNQKIEEMKNSGDYMETADHQAKLQAAEAAKDQEMQTALQTLRDNFAKVGARRAALGEKLKALPNAAGVLQSLSDEFFLADDFEAAQSAMVSRVQKLQGAGITAERPLAKAFKFTVAQSAEFDEWFDDMVAVSKKVAIPGMTGGGDFRQSREGAGTGMQKVGRHPVAI